MRQAQRKKEKDKVARAFSDYNVTVDKEHCPTHVEVIEMF